MFGIMCVDSSGNGVCAGVYNNSDGHWCFSCTAGGYVSGSAVNCHTASVAWSGHACYYKLRKSGTSYYSTFSADGKIWRPETAPVTFGTTPTRLGFGSILGTVVNFAVDFFDVQ
jgi:hypothetical protein